MPNVEFVIGDWSRDGHNQSESFVYECNLTRSQIINAYNRGAKLIGFDLVSDVADDYKDNRISWENLQKLRAAGFKSELDCELTPEEAERENTSKYYTYESGAYLDVESFMEIYLFFVRTGDSSFEYKLAVQDNNDIKIGGYGLFGS